MSNHSFPQRSSSHVTDNRAKNILRSALPPQWILRDQSENDYGIDFHLEFTDENHQVIGQIAALQLKGTENIIEDDQEDGHTVSIKRKTLNLWRAYEMPVFIVLVHVDSGKIYLKSIESEKRKDPARYLFGQSETIGLKFTKKDIRELGRLHEHYRFSKDLRTMDWALPSIMTTHRDLINLFSRYQRDGHQPVDGDGTYTPEDFDSHQYERRIRNVYSNMREISLLVKLPWGIPSVDNTIRDNDWYEGGSEMYECHFTMILEQLDSKFKSLFVIIKMYVETFHSYWKSRNPEFAAYALKDHPLLCDLSWDERRSYMRFP